MHGYKGTLRRTPRKCQERRPTAAAGGMDLTSKSWGSYRSQGASFVGQRLCGWSDTILTGLGDIPVTHDLIDQQQSPSLLECAAFVVGMVPAVRTSRVNLKDLWTHAAMATIVDYCSAKGRRPLSAASPRGFEMRVYLEEVGVPAHRDWGRFRGFR